MAILDDVPGIEVAVQINGQDVVEYDDPDASELDAPCPTSSKYIECIDDAVFAIRCRATSHYKWGYKNHSLHFRAMADGFDDSKPERVKEDIKAAEHLGLIEISVYRTINNGSYVRKCPSIKPSKLEFTEKSLKGKAISHATS
ncbi:hypothetical protein MGN70_006718 [Eutypa lata]|nr:hypothetical protein MGN70_006718 [Eutypa lata]